MTTEKTPVFVYFGRMENLLKNGAKKTKVLWVMLEVPPLGFFLLFSEHPAMIGQFPWAKT